MRRWLLVALLAAFVVGGIWYLRNLIDHGSPLWPFLRLLPGADPIPRIIDLSNDPLLGRVGETLDGHLGEYLARIAGGIVLLLAAPVFMALVRRRPVLIAGTTAIVGFVAWTRTPGTGLSHSSLVLSPQGTALSETRYLIPVFATCAVTVALAAREGDRRLRLAAQRSQPQRCGTASGWCSCRMGCCRHSSPCWSLLRPASCSSWRSPAPARVAPTRHGAARGGGPASSSRPRRAGAGADRRRLDRADRGLQRRPGAWPPRPAPGRRRSRAWAPRARRLRRLGHGGTTGG